MKVLYLVEEAPHAHCYGADFFFEGLCEALGIENVFDYPEKPSLHDGMDECNIDSDQVRPRRWYSFADIASSIDMVFLAVHPTRPFSGAKRGPIGYLGPSIPVVALDFSDCIDDMRDWYEDGIGRPLHAYFKRELLADVSCAYPLPLMYPQRNIPRIEGRPTRAFYHATSHGGRGPGLPRIEIVDGLRCRVRESMLDVGLYESQRNRPSPDEYHAKMMQASVGISWNGAANWDCNRFWENFAFGLAQVAQRPWVKIPNAPVDGEHVVYVDRAKDVAPAVVDLLGDRPKRERIARAGHEHFLKHHASKARAEYVLQTLGIKTAVDVVEMAEMSGETAVN